jgi:dienelactone hydrolase
VAAAALPRYAACEPERILISPNDTPALLVRPDAPGRHPAVLIQHGFAAAKTDVLPLALVLAAYGVVSLLPDAWEHGERVPAEGPRWATPSKTYFLEVARHTLDDMAAALDLLEGLPGVRPDALLVGGFSMGAMLALILGTEDPRVAAVASLAGSPLPDLMDVPAFGLEPPSEELLAWARAHDAAANIHQLAPRPLLLSHGRDDDLVPVAGILRLHAAALPHYAGYPGRLELHLYDHTHTASPEQLGDAVSWVARFFLTSADVPSRAASEELAG